MEKQMNIAIDGPAGAGKSTVAKLLAERLAFIYIDTGAMYRALTWCSLQDTIDVNNEKLLSELLEKTKIELVKRSGSLHILVNNQDVTNEIRSSKVSNYVSYVAKHARIRKEMVSKQQELAESGGTVMDGRDIGTAVLPNAEVKIFLTASVEERAQRRYSEDVRKGESTSFKQLKNDIAKRDRLDSERIVAPLKKADDAIEIDSTSMSIEEVVDRIYTIVIERNGAIE